MDEPANQTIALFERILRLKRLPRTGWLLAGISLPESVAEHSFGTALFTCFLAELVNAEAENPELDGRGGGARIDVGRAVRIALIHDLAESLVTDLPRQATEIYGRATKHEAEFAAMSQILQDTVAGEDYLGLWQEYKAAMSAEARLVRDADRLEMVMQAKEYAAAGNRRLSEFWQDHSWNYSVSQHLFERLSSEYL